MSQVTTVIFDVYETLLQNEHRFWYDTFDVIIREQRLNISREFLWKAWLQLDQTFRANRYLPGAKMSLHQDRNEASYEPPIVSISLGLPAMFLFGGMQRSDRSQRVPLFHGDIVVWGGVDRLRYHGVLPLKDGLHPQLGAQRINFTLRTAG